MDNLCRHDAGTLPRARGWVEEEDYHFYADGGGEAAARASRRGTSCAARVRRPGRRRAQRTIRKVVVRSLTLRTRVMDVRVALSREDRSSTRRASCGARRTCASSSAARTTRRTPFCFECAMVWSGGTKTQAEGRQMREEPSSRWSEVDPRRRGEWLRKRGAARAARSLLTKAPT